MQQIGVLGAAFDPPTKGHWSLLNQAIPYFDEILLVPSVSHAFGKKMTPLAHRLAMLELFLHEAKATFGEGKFRIVNIEETLQKQKPDQPVYTYDVLKALCEDYQGKGEHVALSFILGPDNAKPAVWHKFYRYADIEKNWRLFVVKEEIPIHSRLVREMVLGYQGDESALINELKKMVLPRIAAYIVKHSLYSSN